MRTPLATSAALLLLGACEEPPPGSPTEAAPASASASASPASQPEPPAPPPTPAMRAHRAAWTTRLTESRSDPEGRLPTLLQGLEDDDAAVVSAAITETAREPRGVALSLLEPLVARGAPSPERLAAARVLARHFRAFDFPGAPMDPGDRRIFTAIARAAVAAPPERTEAWLDVIASLFHVGAETGVEHEAAAAAPRLFHAFLGVLDASDAPRLRDLVTAGEGASAKRLAALLRE